MANKNIDNLLEDSSIGVEAKVEKIRNLIKELHQEVTHLQQANKKIRQKIKEKLDKKEVDELKQKIEDL